MLGRASVTTTEQDRRRRERASLRTAAEDVKEHILVFVAGRRFYGVFCSYKAASLVIEMWYVGMVVGMVEGNVAAFTVRRRCRFRSTKNDTELLLVQRFVLEVCSSSVESSEFTLGDLVD